MDVYIECPVCEDQFYTTDGPPTEQIACPSCSRKFTMTSAVKIEPPLLKPDPKPTSPTLSSRLAGQATFAKPISTLSDEVDELPGLEPINLPNDSTIPFTKPKLAGTTEIRKRYKRRNKRKMVLALVTGGALAAVIGILSGLLVMQLQKQSLAVKNASEDSQPETQAASADVDSPDIDSGDPPANQRRDATTTHRVNGTKAKPTWLKDLPPQKLEFMSRKEMDECWEIVQPHIVSLRVTDARGIHEATATLIDSRGWILTSYNAVVGASKIEVTSSAKSIDELPNKDLLSDLARGVVAVDPENDLVILSINRRFVISFANIPIAETNKIVEGEYLVQCAPPSKDNPYARTESKIIIRDNLDALNASGQSQAKRKKLTNPRLKWLVAANDTTPLPGTPLVRPNGTLAGINVFSEKGSGYFLPVDKVRALISSASGDIEPITVLGGSTRETGQSGAIAASHPMRDVSERLNQLGDACQQFGWIAQTDSQYKDLQNFAEQVTLALTHVMENDDGTDDEVKQIDALVKQWKNTLTQRMAAMDSDDLLALRKMNKIAKEELKERRRFVPFYGRVYLGGIDLADKLILRFDVDKTFVNIPFEPTDDDPMLPDSQWLFFVRTPSTVRMVNFSIPGEKNIPAYSAELQFAISPTK